MIRSGGGGEGGKGEGGHWAFVFMSDRLVGNGGYLKSTCCLAATPRPTDIAVTLQLVIVYLRLMVFYRLFFFYMVPQTNSTLNKKKKLDDMEETVMKSNKHQSLNHSKNQIYNMIVISRNRKADSK